MAQMSATEASSVSSPSSSLSTNPIRTPLMINGSTFQSSGATTSLLNQIGGPDALKRMTSMFYTRVFQDAQISLFFQDISEPHAMRLAYWVAEKMAAADDNIKVSNPPDFSSSNNSTQSSQREHESNESKQVDNAETESVHYQDKEIAAEDCVAGSCPLISVRGVTDGIKECPVWIAKHPWTVEREKYRDLSAKIINVPNYSGTLLRRRQIVVDDRSSAHYAGWHSPRRPMRDAGRHFKLDDCRIWLRLHFWACRNAGLFYTQDEAALNVDFVDDKGDKRTALDREVQDRFQDWYMRFLGHFIKIYERSAPRFVQLEAAWSANVANVKQYAVDGRKMADCAGVRDANDVMKLLSKEKQKVVKKAVVSGWPYD